MTKLNTARFLLAASSVLAIILGSTAYAGGRVNLPSAPVYVKQIVTRISNSTSPADLIRIGEELKADYKKLVAAVDKDTIEQYGAELEDAADNISEAEINAMRRGVAQSLNINPAIFENVDLDIDDWMTYFREVEKLQRIGSPQEKYIEVLMETGSMAATPAQKQSNKANANQVVTHITTKGAKPENKDLEEKLKKVASAVKDGDESIMGVSKKLLKQGYDMSAAATSATDDALVAGNLEHHNIALLAGSVQAMTNKEFRNLFNTINAHSTQKVAVTHDISNAIGANIAGRMENIAVASASGVAAGDENNYSSIGAWVRGLYGVTKQGPINDNAGYAGRNAGGTVGVDFAVNENVVLGVAYSNVHSGFKFKQNRTGDKLNAVTHTGSVYGQVEFNNFYWQPIVSYNFSRLTSKDIVPLAGGKSVTATGKFKNTGFSIDNSFGYKISINDGLMVIPNVGIRYANFKDGSYTRKGAGVFNTTTSAVTNHYLTGSAGAKVVMSHKISDDIEIQPGVHGSIEKNFNAKTKIATARLSWTDQDLFESNAPVKQAQIGYNAGASVLTKHKNIEVLAAYNLNLRKKYQSHQGSLKLKISL